MSGIIYNGVDLETLGVICERFPTLHRPARKSVRYSVPGRNGDIIIPQDAWENVIVEYDVYLRSSAGQNLSDVAGRLLNALNAPADYAVLEDPYDTTHFRHALYLDGADISNFNNLFGRTTLRFDCKPQNFIKGLEYVEIAESSSYLVIKKNTGARGTRPRYELHIPLEATQGVKTININVQDMQSRVIIGVQFNAITGRLYDGMTLDFETKTFKLANGTYVQPNSQSGNGNILFENNGHNFGFRFAVSGGSAGAYAICDTRAFDL